MVLSLSILVIIHECGHFIPARLFKVRVEKFYLFFNPWFSLWKFRSKRSETEYGIGWLPLGGYVKLAGMIDESMDKEQLKQPEQPWEFRSKPALQRLIIMIGGIVMNFILAFFIYAMILLHWGEEYIPFRNYTMGFAFNETAENAGFRDGDIPLTADGKLLETIDMKSLMALAEAAEVTVLRDGAETGITLPEGFNKVLLDSKGSFIVPRFPFVVSSVNNGSPAKQAGLLAGDSIVGVEGNLGMAADELTDLFNEHKEQAVAIAFYRNGALQQTEITPNENGKIGVIRKSPVEVYQTIYKRYNFFTSFPAGLSKGVSTMKSYLGQFKYFFTKEGVESLGGFGTIASIFPPLWDWEAFWSMTAFLSIILGVMNVLPIPALDGGHVLFLLYEIISGRKPNEKFLEYAQITGMIIILGLVLYSNGNDILRFLR